jgi:hypothetical protein
MMPVLSIVGAAALLAQGAGAPPPKSLVQAAKCDAGKAQALLRRAADTSALAEAIRLSGSHNLRVVWPGDRVDEDANGDRLTIEVDSSNKIARLRCG